MQITDSGENIKGSALLCLNDKDANVFVIQAVETMGYSVFLAHTDQEALDKMRFNLYDLIIIEDGFGSSLNDDNVLKTVRDMDQSQRRRIFVALLGDRWETGDEMNAFALSVNLLINIASIGKLREILTQALSENERLYKVFNDVRVESGRG